MTTVKSFIKRYSVAIYFILAIAVSWACIVMAVGAGRLPVNPDESEDTLAMMYIAMLAGPTLAGLLLTALTTGRAGFRDLGNRLGTWRVDVRWYALVLLTAPLVAMIVLTVLSLFSSTFTLAIITSEDKPALLFSGLMAGLMVGIFEEIGWTGFALPRLRQHANLLTTGLILGVVWGLWHFLPFWTDDSFTDGLAFTILLTQLFAWLLPYRLLMVLVHERTGSLLLVILMHASLLASLQILVPAELTGSDLLTWLLAWAVALWIVAGVMITSTRSQTVNIPHKLQESTV